MGKFLTYLGAPLLLAALTSVLLSALPVGAAPTSGHVDVTVKTIPERPVAGEETRIIVSLHSREHQSLASATVLVSAVMLMAQPDMPGMQHGNTLEAYGGATRLSAQAQPSNKPGEYLASLKLTGEGDWKITATSGDSAAELKVAVIQPQPNAGQSAAPVPAPGGAGQPVSVKVASASVKASSMEAVHASYLELTTNIGDLRWRVDQWKQGDEASLNIAIAKLERIEAVLGSVTWPEVMAKAVLTTADAVARLAQALKDKDLAAAEVASKVLGDGSHDVTHDYFDSWLPGVQLGADEGQVATAQGTTLAKGHDDGHGGAEAESSGPNWLIVGGFLGLIALVVGTAAIMKRQMIAAAGRQSNHTEELAGI